MNDKRVVWRDLVHDIIDSGAAEGVETGCGLILRATPDKMTDAATSCFQCISGEFEFRREADALDLLKSSPDMHEVLVARAKKHLTPKGE
jgi:hypothetical protein